MILIVVISLFLFMPIKLKDKILGLLYCYLTYFFIHICINKIFFDVSTYFFKYNGDIFVWAIFFLFFILWVIQRENPYRFLWVLFFLPTIVSYGHDWDGAYDAYLFFRPYGYVLLSLIVRIEDNLSPMLSLIKFSLRDYSSSYWVAVLEIVSVFVNTVIGFIVFFLYRKKYTTNLYKSSDSVGFSHIIIATAVFGVIVILSYCNIQLFQIEEQSNIITFLNHQIISAASWTIFLVAFVLFFKAKKTKLYIVSFLLLFLCTPTFVSLKFINGDWGWGYWDFYTPFYCMKSIGIQIVTLLYSYISENMVIHLNDKSILSTIEFGSLLSIPIVYSILFLFRKKIQSFVENTKSAIKKIVVFDKIICGLLYSCLFSVVVGGVMVLIDSNFLTFIFVILLWIVSLVLILKKVTVFNNRKNVIYMLFLFSFPIVTMHHEHIILYPWAVSLWRNIFGGWGFNMWDLLNLVMMVFAVVIMYFMRKKEKNILSKIYKKEIN